MRFIPFFQLLLGVIHAGQLAEPAADLAALATKKAQALASQAAAITTLSTTFAGGAGHALSLSGTLPQIASQLTSNAGPGYEYTLCTACLVVAPAGRLFALKQLVGV